MRVIVVDAHYDATTQPNGDPTVTSGGAEYVCNEKSAGVFEWFKVSEFESIDAIFSWNNLTNVPTQISGTTSSFTTELKTKLDGIDENANKYEHPATHLATMITQETDHRFLTEDERAAIATISNKVDANHTHTIVTTENDGFMSSDDKIKLNAIEDQANKYVHPVTHSAEIITAFTNKNFVTDSEKTIVSKFSQSIEGNLLYDGNPIGGSFGLTFGPNLKIKCISGEALNEFDPVYMDFNGLVKKCDNTNLDTAFRFCGINLTSVAASGEEVEVVVSGTVENSAYDFGDPTDPANTKRSTPLWIGVNKLTQTEPTIGFACIVAIPVGQHKILINKQFPIFI